jgi:hypothetical protein
MADTDVRQERRKSRATGHTLNTTRSDAPEFNQLVAADRSMFLPQIRAHSEAGGAGTISDEGFVARRQAKSRR